MKDFEVLKFAQKMRLRAGVQGLERRAGKLHEIDEIYFVPGVGWKVIACEFNEDLGRALAGSMISAPLSDFELVEVPQ